MTINLLDYPAANGRPVQQAHADHCAEHGHTTWTLDGADQGRCPRCGEVTEPSAQGIPSRVSVTWPACSVCGQPADPWGDHRREAHPADASTSTHHASLEVAR